MEADLKRDIATVETLTGKLTCRALR
jgi:hypothetical protein